LVAATVVFIFVSFLTPAISVVFRCTSFQLI
jgi:hypothetical protein